MVATQCIICNCKLKNDVDEMLNKKVSYTIIVQYLKEHAGIELSKTSVSRHKRNHLNGNNDKPRQLQKGKILQARKRASGKKSSKKSSKKSTKIKKSFKSQEPDQVLKRDTKIMNNVNTGLVDESLQDVEKKRKGYLKEYEKLMEDIDVVNEFVWTLAVAKDRVKRALEEEENAELILATTGTAIKDYGQLVHKFDEVTKGLDSITQLKQIQLMQMITDIFSRLPITDKTRYELNKLISNMQVSSKDKAIPIRVIDDEKDEVVAN